MKRCLLGLLVLVPSVALAQPSAPSAPSAAPDDPSATLSPPGATPVTAPPPGYAPPQPGQAPPSPGYAPPPPGYAPPPPGYLTPPPPRRERHGLTFEANLGLGFVWANTDDENSETETGLGGLSLGLGGWLSDRVSLTARLAGATFSPDDDVRVTLGFVGPSLQYWPSEHFWIGGGLGIAVLSVAFTGDGESDSESENGFGLDFRAGYTFSTRSNHTFNISVELNPSFFSREDTGGEDVNVNAFGILLGYQYL